MKPFETKTHRMPRGRRVLKPKPITLPLNDAMRPALEQAELEDRLNRTGLSSMDMGRLHDLRNRRGL